MKDSLKSVIRHFLTATATLGTFLASASLIPADQAAGVDAAGAALTDPLAIILTALAVPLARWVVSWLPWVGNSGGPMSAVVVWTAAAGAWAGFLPSCSPQQIEAMKQTPVEVRYIDKSGAQVRYSTKDGLTATVDKREESAIPPATTGAIEVDTESGK